MNNISIKWMLLTVLVAVSAGFATWKYFDSAKVDDMLEERQIIESQGWFYNGESLISVSQYNSIQKEIETSAIEGDIDALEIRGSTILASYNFGSTTDYPNLEREKLGIESKVATGIAGTLPIVVTMISILFAVYRMTNLRKSRIKNLNKELAK
jgi:hypothetical protein